VTLCVWIYRKQSKPTCKWKGYYVTGILRRTHGTSFSSDPPVYTVRPDRTSNIYNFLSSFSIQLIIFTIIFCVCLNCCRLKLRSLWCIKKALSLYINISLSFYLHNTYIMFQFISYLCQQIKNILLHNIFNINIFRHLCSCCLDLKCKF
jgi:hypothetical protein